MTSKECVDTPDRAERSFWTRKMEEAADFMEAMRTWPIEESGEPMASMQEATDGLEVVFSSTRINGTFPRIYFIREGLIPKFRAAARAMNDRGWIMKVEDGYRSPAMQRAQTQNPRHFDLVLQKSIWELGGRLPDPAFLMRRMSAIIACRCRVGTHVSGSAIDISVLDRETGEEVPRGGTYVEISHLTPMDSPFASDEEQANRREITALMRAADWWDYPWEFWHYSSGDSYAESFRGEGRAARYGPVDFDGASIRSIGDPESDELLNPQEFFVEQIQAALDRFEAVQK